MRWLVRLVRSAEVDLDPSDNSASVSTRVDEPPGGLAFATAVTTVPETAGRVPITVVRQAGAAGTVSVGYRTIAGSAVPGVDFTPVSGVLVFGPGETQKSISVPVLANPHDAVDEMLAIVLESPSGGAWIGSQSVARLVIHNIDPDLTPPSITNLTWDGAATGIYTVSLTYSEDVGSANALNPASYQLVELGSDGRLGTGDDVPLAFYGPIYDPATHVVTLVPATPLAAGRFYGVMVAGVGSAAVHDLAGHGDRRCGQRLIGYVVRRPLRPRGSIGLRRFERRRGVAQNLGPRLPRSGSGADGEGQVLRVVDVVPRRSKLSGSLGRNRTTGDGITNLGVIDGLGAFGQIRINLKTPPFVVTQYPFSSSTQSQSLIQSGPPSPAPSTPSIRPRSRPTFAFPKPRFR